MRMIGNIPRAEQAERFSDYLLASGVGNMVEESPSGAWLVWVEKDDDVERGKRELAAFLADPASTKYAVASKAESIRKEEQKKRERRRRHFVDVRTRWGQAKQWAAPVTLSLIAISIAVSIGTKLGAELRPAGTYLTFASYDPQDIVERVRDYADEIRRTGRVDRRKLQELMNPDGLADVKRGQVWRLITPIFLHFSILHLLFNMFWLRDLGGMIEAQRGSWLLLLLLLLVATISNTAQYLWTLHPFFGGMSGVNYGLFGYIWVKQRYQPHLGLGVGEQTTMILIAWLFLCMTGLVGPVANAAHVAGLIVGAAVGYVPYAFKRMSRKWR